MTKKYRIGIFGIALASTNYGVTALGISQIRLLEDLAKESNSVFEYVVFSDESQDDLLCIKDYLPIERIEFSGVIRYRKGLKGLREIKRIISTCDLIIDLTYGDSFSDIYGMKKYILYSIPKILSLGNTLILGPQTYGPYDSLLSKEIAKYILKRADYVISRDADSITTIHQLNIERHLFTTSDLAMKLPYTKKKKSEDGRIAVGLNVSSLLWDRGEEFGLSLNYRDFVTRLLEELKKENEVHLIAHTYDAKDREYEICKELSTSSSSIVLAPRFSDPIDAKNYISQLDFFIGARMHATIAAFSSGVPVAPVAYSKKFEGLYSSIGYPYTIDCRYIDVATAIDKVVDMINRRDFYKSEVQKSLGLVDKENKKYEGIIKQALFVK